MTEYINLEFHITSMFRVALKIIECSLKTWRTARKTNDSLRVWSKFRSKVLARRLFWLLLHSTFIFSTLHFSCIFPFFLLWETNKKKARTNEVVIIFVVAEWTVFSKKNWDVERFERLICSQMFLNSWLLIPLSFSSLLICSLILDF